MARTTCCSWWESKCWQWASATFCWLVNRRTFSEIFHYHTGKVGWKNNHRLNGLTVLPRVGAPLLLLTFTELSRPRGPASSWTHIRFSSDQAGPQHFSVSLRLVIRKRQLFGFPWQPGLFYLPNSVVIWMSHIVTLVVIGTALAPRTFSIQGGVMCWDSCCLVRYQTNSFFFFLFTAVWTGWRPKEEGVSGWPLQLHAEKRYVSVRV